MYIQSVAFKQSYRCFTQNETFDFTDKSLILLVGDQGCGKSSLLERMAHHDHKTLDIKLTPIGAKGVSSFYFDSEKMNPRIVDPIHYTNLDGTDKGIGYAASIKARFTSHGETLVCFTVDALKKAENCVVFIDEPESALSLRNQFRLIDEIITAVTGRNCQVFVSTHCLSLIQAMPDLQVLSLEHRKWMGSDEFIQTQKNPKIIVP